MCKCKLRVCCFGLALGVTWAVVVFFLGIMGSQFGYGIGLVNVLSSIYLGYTTTVLGSIIGAVWAFFDALIGGVIVAWLYNVFSKCCVRMEKCRTHTETGEGE